MKSLELKIPPPAVALITAGLMWLAARWLPLGFAFPAQTAIAILLALLGAATAIAGVLQFSRARTTVNPMRVEAASSLVTHGVFARTRNPMYLGLLLVLAAWSIHLASVAAVFVLPIFVVYINRFQIGPEERAMHKLFGESYRHYTNRTRRWI